MKQYYTMQLLRKAEKDDIPFDEIAKRAYDTIMLFQALPKEYCPNYLTANSKIDCKLMDWDYKNFYDMLKKNSINNDGASDLGYIFKCFSSLNDSKACSYSMHVGISNVKFINSLIVNFSYNMDYFNEEVSRQISKLFRQSIKIFEPYFACVYNSLLPSSKIYNTNDDETLPTAVHWLNYWSEDMIKNIGENKIKKLIKKCNKIEFEEGMLKLQDIAINSDNPQDVEYKAKIKKNYYKKTKVYLINLI